ncbi:MAG: peptidase M20, partial [Telluria sp.]
MKKTLLLTLLFASVAAKADTAPEFDPQRLSKHVKVLSSDAFEGREPSTAGEKKTVAYLIEQFKAAGVKPGGELVNGKRSWTQDVPLGRFEIKGPVTLTLDDGKQRQEFKQGEQMAVRAAMNGASRVEFNRAPLVFVGYGVTAPERNW